MVLRDSDLLDSAGERGETVAPETDWQQVSYQKQPTKIQ